MSHIFYPSLGVVLNPTLDTGDGNPIVSLFISLAVVSRVLLIPPDMGQSLPGIVHYIGSSDHNFRLWFDSLLRLHKDRMIHLESIAVSLI